MKSPNPGCLEEVREEEVWNLSDLAQNDDTIDRCNSVLVGAFRHEAR